MSDEDHDVDIESDEDDESLVSSTQYQYMTQAEKRAHHNALERKRRDHIKESFHNLRDSIPSLHGEKITKVPIASTSGQASRAQILKQATEYIQFMAKKNSAIQTDIDDLKKQNGTLEQQVRALEKAKMTGAFAAQSSSLSSSSASADNRSNLDASLSDSSDSENMTGGRKRKKFKTK